ncbi:type II secretion system protein [Butyrivibrio sp. FC2001]|uniref:type II secretion system protein n=1 Tax=Butyrivibrio sp. FC2001 TaxID=1280671 RepID=UPI00047A7812|nr:prepilin-type N-terminal cleavage/methylation domain-containing protein [Butyrivibrio sp. FC2001]
MRVKILKRLKSKKGESLIETLVALLIGVLALMMLPGAVVGAARANRKAAEQSVYSDENAVNFGVEVTDFSIR